jgi:hypothetical protein
LSTTLHRSTQKHLRWHPITKILRNGPGAHFPFTGFPTGQSIINPLPIQHTELLHHPAQTKLDSFSVYDIYTFCVNFDLGS